MQWNEPGARYILVDKEKLPRFPFSIDQEGVIYVTQPLDREEKDSVSKSGKIHGQQRQSPVSVDNSVQDRFYLKTTKTPNCVLNLSALLLSKTREHPTDLTHFIFACFPVPRKLKIKG